MPLSKKLDRTLRPVEDESDNESYYEVTDRSSPSIIDTGDGVDVASSSADDDAGSDDGEAMVRTR
jgi:ribosomal RNA-processing protein 36